MIGCYGWVPKRWWIIISMWKKKRFRHLSLDHWCQNANTAQLQMHKLWMKGSEVDTRSTDIHNVFRWTLNINRNFVYNRALLATTLHFCCTVCLSAASQLVSILICQLKAEVEEKLYVAEHQTVLLSLHFLMQPHTHESVATPTLITKMFYLNFTRTNPINTLLIKT